MTFQFLCPQGHLLQGEEAHMGMQCQCPQCGVAFIIPTIDAPAPSGQSASPASQSLELAPLDEGEDFVEEPIPARERPAEPAPSLDLAEIAATELGTTIRDEPMLHIPCPNGHELETPMEMVGERAQCPHCGVEFKLRREKSIEYLHQQELLDRRRARFWFQLSIMAASFVIMVLLVMVGIMIFSQ
jgi:hypothetical protein